MNLTSTTNATSGSRRRSRRRVIALMLLAAAIAIAVGCWWVLSDRRARLRRIAVVTNAGGSMVRKGVVEQEEVILHPKLDAFLNASGFIEPDSVILPASVHDAILDAVARSPKLTSISVPREGCNLDDDSLKQMFRRDHKGASLWFAPPATRRLILRATRVSDESAAFLSRLHGLARLSLAKTGVTDAAVPALAALPGLERLDLSDTAVRLPFSDTKIDELPSWFPRLEYMALDGCRLDEGGFRALARIESLHTLAIRRTRVDANVLAPLSEALSIQDLYCDHNEISPEAAAAIAAIPTLERLYVTRGMMPPAALEQLRELRPDVYVDERSP